MNIRRIIILLLFIMFFATTSQAGETWKITSLDWQPYSGSELTNQGNSVQMLRELLRKEGIKLLVEFYPWKRAQKIAKKDDYVGFFPAWPEEVGSGFVASPPIDWSTINILKRTTDTITFTSIDELFKNNKVGIIKTYVYPKAINDAMKKYPNNVDKSPSEVSLVKKLSRKRIKIAITDPNVMLFLANKEGIDNIEPDIEIMKKELVLAFRVGKDNEKRLKLLKKLLKK